MQVARFEVPRSDTVRRLGLIGAAVQFALALLLAGIASRTEFPNPHEPIPRGVTLGLLFALPAVVGALGAIGVRRAVLAAAACWQPSVRSWPSPA